MTNVLITGGAGFIGSNLVDRCLSTGWNVSVVDDMSNGHEEFVPHVRNPNYQLIRSDFADRLVLQDIEMGFYRYVFHLAAQPRVSHSVEFPFETHKTNVDKTLQLIEACRSSQAVNGGLKRLVFASSSSVYGDAVHLPVHESASHDPRSPYALQKSIVEQYLQLYGRIYGFDSVCLRFFNVFGDNAMGGTAYSTALASWLTNVKRGLSLRSDGDGSQVRDLCHVDNVTDACIRAAENPHEMYGRAFNVACGKVTSNKELLDYIVRRYPNSQVVHAPWRPGDVMRTHADISRARDELGYRPIVDVWEGVERMCTWYDQNWLWAGKLSVNL